MCRETGRGVGCSKTCPVQMTDCYMVTGMIRRFAMLAAVLFAGTAGRAQTDGTLPAFGAGERLVYTVSYRAAMWPNTDMGDVVLTVEDDLLDGVPALKISARATVKGMFRWFYKLDDRYHSWLRTSDMLPVRAEADLLEGDYRFSSSFVYDWDEGVSFNTYRDHRYPEATETDVELAGDAMDAISLFYTLRMHDIASYTPGQTMTLALLLKDDVRFIKYRYYGREVREIKGLGKVKTLKFSCQLVNDGADSFEEGSEFFVWISDDANKVPVFLESPLRVGSIRARLVEYGGLQHVPGTN